MGNRIYDEKNGFWYERHGDYYIPCLTVPERKQHGKWGERRRRYLKQNNRNLYDAMLLSGRLETHLFEIDKSATEMMETLTAKMKSLEGITEKLKAEDQMAWVRAMNNIKSRAEEIVMKKLITDTIVPPSVDPR